MVRFQEESGSTRKRGSKIARDRFVQALGDYRKSITAVVQGASEKFQKDVLPLVDVIKSDLDANRSKIPKECFLVSTARRRPRWEEAFSHYVPMLDKAAASLDLKSLVPAGLFPENQDMGDE